MIEPPTTPEVPSPPLRLLHVDDTLAVVDKPAGLMVHDSRLAGGETDFLADRLREQLGRPIHLVHRLDRATSGCLLLAFDRETASRLGQAMMADGKAAALQAAGDTTAVEDAVAGKASVQKDYWAVCRGWPDESFLIDHPLDGGPGKPAKKPAITRFTRLATCELAMPSQGFETARYSLLCAQPETGRFRQIRRHLKHAFHHLIGDTSHGDGRHNRNFRMIGIHRMLLHARRLAFMHPHTGECITATAPVDAEFAKALALFDYEA